MGSDLEVQAAQHTFGPRQRLIVLHEDAINPGGREHLAIIGFGKEAALIAEDLRREKLHVLDAKRFDVHGSCLVSLSPLARLSPLRQRGYERVGAPRIPIAAMLPTRRSEPTPCTG